MIEQQSLFYLSNVLKNYKLNYDEVAAIMFPTNKNADLALRRVLKGEGHVSVDQLEALAQYIGISVPTLYQVGCDMWLDASDGRANIFSIRRGIFVANFSFDTHRLIVSQNDSVIYNAILPESEVLVQDLMNTINNITNGTNSN